MITKEQIIDIAREELTPIGWHEEHAKYIDGLDTFAERLVKLCNISHVNNLLCCSFEPDNKTSSATRCKCGREKWEHPKAT